MANPLGDITKWSELKQRLLFVLGALVVFRIGAAIPVPEPPRNLPKPQLSLFNLASKCRNWNSFSVSSRSGALPDGQ